MWSLFLCLGVLGLCASFLVFWCFGFFFRCVCVLVSMCTVCWWSCVCLWVVCFVSCGVWRVVGCVLCLCLVFLFPMWLVLFGVACLRVVYWLLGYLVCVRLLGVLCMCLGCLLYGVCLMCVLLYWVCCVLYVWRGVSIGLLCLVFWLLVFACVVVVGFGVWACVVFCFWVLAWFCFLVSCWGFVFCWAVVCWFGWWFVFVGCLGGFCVLGVGGCVLFFWSYIICVDCGGALRVSACVGFLFGVTACFWVFVLSVRCVLYVWSFCSWCWWSCGYW